MYEQIVTHIRRATRDSNDKLNIFTGTAHERVESLLAKTGHNFYAYGHPTFKGNWKTQYAPLPNNYFILNKDLGEHQIPIDIHPDLVISHHKYSQFQVLSPISQKYNIPHINIEHTIHYDWPKEKLSQWRQMVADVNVFITEFSRDAWGWTSNDSIVIEHGVDTDFFKPNNFDRSNIPLTICNDFVNRDVPCGYSFWKEATKDIKTKLLGDTPGLSESPKSINELLQEYQKSSIFLCTSRYSPIPYSLLEAMSCGLCVIARPNCAIPDIIKNEENGLLVNTTEDMNRAIIKLQNDKDMREEIGNKARDTILQRFNLNRFVNDWNNVFERFV